MMDMVTTNTIVTIALDQSECTEELLETESDQQEQLCSAWLTLIHLVNCSLDGSATSRPLSTIFMLSMSILQL